MAVAFVDSDLVGSDAGSTFPTATVTGSTSNAIVLMAYGFLDPGDSLTPTARVGGSATGCVQIGSTLSVSSGAFRMALFYKLAPGSGSLSIDGTLSISRENLFCAAAVYSGVDQSTPVGTLATGSASSTSLTLSPSGGTANGRVVVWGQSFASALTSSAGTERENLYRASVDKTGVWGDLAGASGAVSWSQSSALWGAIGVALLEAADAGVSWLPFTEILRGAAYTVARAGLTPPDKV